MCVHHKARVKSIHHSYLHDYLLYISQKKLQNKFMQAFQECDAMVLLFSPINSRAITSYGYVLSPPGNDLATDLKNWAIMGVMSTFKVEWKSQVYIRTDRLPR